MSDSKLANKFVTKSIESYVKTALVFLVIYASFMIFKPFLLPVIWGIIIAVALYPLHKKLTRLLKNKSGIAATIITLVLLSVLVGPSISFSNSLIDNIQELATGAKEGTLVIPAPTDDVAEWPIIGKKVHAAWQSFSDNLTAGIMMYKEQLKNVGGKFISLLSSFVGGLLTFFIAIIIAGIFLAQSNKGYQYVNTFSTALAGEKGDEMVENSRATISSVVNGILGTAIIQTIIIASAFFVFDVPGAPILTIIVMFFAIAQIPAILVVLPVLIYMFSHLSGGAAAIFTVWAIVGALSDNFLKPMLLGRGMQIPMLVILIGSIGGMMIMGIIGLFIGAVIFAMAYQLFHLWIDDTQEALEKKS